MASLSIPLRQSQSDVYDAIKNALLNKQPISVVYDGKPERQMCPHVLGLNKENKRQMLAYQFAGYSSSGLAADGDKSNWRCVTLDKITTIRAIPGVWHTASNHSRSQTCVREIHYEVAQ